MAALPSSHERGASRPRPEAARYRQSSTPPWVTTSDRAAARARRRCARTAATARALNSTSVSPPSGANAGSWRRQRAASAGPARVDLGVGVALEDAEAALAQAGDRSRPAGRRRAAIACRRVVGARQVAGEDRLDALAGERLGDARRLPAAARAERGVELALHPHLGVPHGLAVAHGDDPRRLVVPRRRAAHDAEQPAIERVGARVHGLGEDVAVDRLAQLGAGEAALDRRARDRRARRA